MNYYGYIGIPIGQVPGHFQYPVSGRISGKSNPVSGRIPDIKKGRIIRPDNLVHPYFKISCLPNRVDTKFRTGIHASLEY
jgi:hypothetical protein